MTVLRVELPDEVVAELTRVASELGSTPEALLRDAAEDLIFDQADRDQRIIRGLAGLDAGSGVEHGRVVEWMRSWGTASELPPPRCDD